MDRYGTSTIYTVDRPGKPCRLWCTLRYFFRIQKSDEHLEERIGRSADPKAIGGPVKDGSYCDLGWDYMY